MKYAEFDDEEVLSDEEAEEVSPIDAEHEGEDWGYEKERQRCIDAEA